MKTEYKVIVLSAVLGLFFWVVDAVLDYFFFYEGTFLEILISDVPIHELYIRSVVLFLFIIFGIIISRLLAGYESAGKVLRQQSPIYLLLIVISSIFVAELLVMFLLTFIPHPSLLHEALLDSLVLIVFVFPILYIFLLRPLTSYITERKKAEEAMQTLVESTAGTMGQEFFERVVGSLCEWLGTDCAIIGKIVDENNVKALSMQLDGEIIHDYSYMLNGTPCENVAEKGYCVYPEDVCKLFPDDKDLVDLGAVGYVGIPLRDKDNKSIGILCAISRQKLDLPSQAEEVMDIIAAEASAEIERTKAEGSLRKSEEKYRDFFKYDITGDFTSTPEGQLIDCNPAFLQIFGFTSLEEAKSVELESLYPTPVEFHEMVSRIEKEKKIVNYEHEMRKVDGETIFVNQNTIGEFDEQDKLIKMRGYIIDITERKQAEEERDRLNRELMDKNKELEQIVYVTSHDLRSPLVNIQGFGREVDQAFKQVRSVLDSEDVSPELKEKLIPYLKEDIPEALQYIQSSTSKMDSLLTGLLRFSRLGRNAIIIKPLDMNKLVSNVVMAFEYQTKEKGTTLKVDDLPPCIGDEVQINQVFSNLLDNALKCLDPKRAGVIRISGEQEKGQAVYCVEDNGIGIAAEHWDKIFEIFRCLDPKAIPGEGLGLTIARKILHQHNGKIWVESEPGKGSKFFVSLPTKSRKTWKRRVK